MIHKEPLTNLVGTKSLNKQFKENQKKFPELYITSHSISCNCGHKLFDQKSLIDFKSSKNPLFPPFTVKAFGRKNHENHHKKLLSNPFLLEL